MTDMKTNDFSYERSNIPIDASFIDGFDVDDDEDRWAGKSVTSAPPRYKQMKRLGTRRR